MKNGTSLAIAAFCLLLVVRGSLAQQRKFGVSHNFGVGVIIGEPTGISAKLWTSPLSSADYSLKQSREK